MIVLMTLVLVFGLVTVQKALAFNTFPLHTAQSGADVNGNQPDTSDQPTVIISNSIASGWDGTLTYQMRVKGGVWVGVTCSEIDGLTQVTTTVAKANLVSCRIPGAEKFRARVSGRTTGTVTAFAIFGGFPTACDP